MKPSPDFGTNIAYGGTSAPLDCQNCPDRLQVNETAMLLDCPRLLIADDDCDFRATLVDVLRGRGFETLEAGDGEEALDLLDRHRVHLLLLDMQMPRLSGLETIHRLRERELETAVPWILISGALDESIVAQARAAAAFSVLPKPLRLPQLTGAVQDALRQVYNWPA